ncbi:hypothetical protein LFM09_01910 [Lentzea alba]|uniref:hypothetical protein n=1 Tax=Lentzea alba TaxID=2714351 RepID=UPI0039BF3D3A
MYAPLPEARPRIPYATSLAAASVWYAALVAGYAAWALKSGEWQGIIGALLTGLVPWLLTSLIVWLILRATNVGWWVLIVLALPFFFVMWFMISLFAGLAIAALFMMNGG